MIPQRCHNSQDTLSQISQRTDVNHYKLIHFVSFGLVRIEGNKIYRQQIVKQNEFLHKLTIIPIYNITSDILYSDFIFKGRKIGPIESFETKDKWLLVTTNNMKQRTQVSFDDILKDYEISMLVNNHQNYNTDMINYAAIYQSHTSQEFPFSII